MKSKVKSDAAEADLLLKEGKKSLKEEKKSQAKKTRKDKNIKVFEVLNSLFASLTFRLISSKNE